MKKKKKWCEPKIKEVEKKDLGVQSQSCPKGLEPTCAFPET